MNTKLSSKKIKKLFMEGWSIKALATAFKTTRKEIEEALRKR